MKEGFDEKALRQLVKAALREDIRKRDLTSTVLIPFQTQARGIIRAKGDGILAGLEAALATFREIDEEVSFQPEVRDGAGFCNGDVIVRVAGRVQSLLAGERTALNFLQHLSGIATLTRHFVERVKAFAVTIVDTRKTIPGLRELEKYAVRMGGGTNHRMGLFDHILLKENHFQTSPFRGLPDGYARAIQEARKKAKKNVLVIAESRTLKEAQEAARAGADIVMLDNMSLHEMRTAVSLIKGEHGDKRPLLEASGGVNLENVEAVAACGVDRISVGSITLSAPPVDLAMYLQGDAQ